MSDEKIIAMNNFIKEFNSIRHTMPVDEWNAMDVHTVFAQRRNREDKEDADER